MLCVCVRVCVCMCQTVIIDKTCERPGLVWCYRESEWIRVIACQENWVVFFLHSICVCLCVCVCIGWYGTRKMQTANLYKSFCGNVCLSRQWHCYNEWGANKTKNCMHVLWVCNSRSSVVIGIWIDIVITCVGNDNKDDCILHDMESIVECKRNEGGYHFASIWWVPLLRIIGHAQYHTENACHTHWQSCIWTNICVLQIHKS